MSSDSENGARRGEACGRRTTHPPSIAHPSIRMPILPPNSAMFAACAAAHGKAHPRNLDRKNGNAESGIVRPKDAPLADMGISLSVKGISCTRVILDFHSKSLDLATIIFDLSKVTLPDE